MKKITIFLALILMLSSIASANAKGKKPLLVKFESEIPTTIEISADSISKEKIKIPIKPFTYEEAKSEKEIASRFHPGKGTALVETTIEGNLMVLCHSAYFNDVALECEKLRDLIEGGAIKKKLTDDRIKENLDNLVGNIVTVKQRKTVQSGEIAATIRVPHEKLPEFERDSRMVVQFLQTLELDETTAKTLKTVASDDQTYILLTFCGWGPPTANEWWLWDRFIIIIKLTPDETR